MLETARLRLEPWSGARRDFFVALAADPRVVRYIGTGEPWPRAKAERKFAESLEHWQAHGFGKRSLIEQASGAWLGFVELCHVGPGAVKAPGEIEIGWWLTPPAWGRGLATEAARTLLDDAFGELGLEGVIGRYQPGNAASARVMDKLGMRFERQAVGRHGERVRIHAIERADLPRLV